MFGSLRYFGEKEYWVFPLTSMQDQTWPMLRLPLISLGFRIVSNVMPNVMLIIAASQFVQAHDYSDTILRQIAFKTFPPVHTRFVLIRLLTAAHLTFRAPGLYKILHNSVRCVFTASLQYQPPRKRGLHDTTSPEPLYHISFRRTRHGTWKDCV